MAVTIRQFVEADYPRIVEIYNRCEPDAPWSEISARRCGMQRR